ncbi:MAG: YfiM family protein [Melioribacteraceae bacterium]|nr:YfiM family protein [Melioribacteraceae bacterium]MCF8355347.1 YfiM family protein [Melioribacteraceae bacterium]MCF8392339.1 YfiM family protein [Melioribacteraceae bacterium]MCF8417859.1 YfiM family protein [Melioribacteraceae bacterium]
MKNIFLICISLLIFSSHHNAQIDSTEININRLALVGGVTAAGFVYAYGIQNNMWWKGEKSSFHTNWQNDWEYALGSDKFGHFYFAYLLTNIYYEAFRWSDIPGERSMLYASLLTFSYQTFIEIRDGFSKGYGFSWGDFGANSLGALYPHMQKRFHFLKPISFKISYYPSQRYKEGNNQYILDDYESTFNWISFDVNQWLPKNIDKAIPDFINVAIGHSVNNLGFENSRQHELYLSLDLNLKKLPGDGWFLNLIKGALDFYHLPSPAVKIYPDVVWYGLKF